MIGNQCIVESCLEYDDKNQEYEDDDTDSNSRTYSKFSGSVTGYIPGNYSLFSFAPFATRPNRLRALLKR